MVTSAGTLNDGGVVSSIVNVAVVETELFEGSVAVKVTLAEPVTPQPSLKAIKLLDQTMPQASDAIAPPLLPSQVFKAAVFPAPSHSTVRSLAEVVMVGELLSSTVT